MCSKKRNTSAATMQDFEIKLRKWSGNARDRGAGGQREDKLLINIIHFLA